MTYPYLTLMNEPLAVNCVTLTIPGRCNPVTPAT